MGYLHIDNLYKSQDILLFRECYALEKVHGTSAHVGWSVRGLSFHSGGEKQAKFEALFDKEALTAAFIAMGHAEVTVYGEAYGGKCQAMSATYGPELRFIAFDVQVGDCWLSVPDAEQVAQALGIEFVPYRRVSTDVACLNAERDCTSDVAVRRGIAEPKPREGVVLRPLIEVTKNNGSRIIAKHKGEAFAERIHTPKVDRADYLPVLEGANAIAAEWVTPMRLSHVLDKFPDAGIERTGDIVKAMIEDVRREAAGEIVESKEALRAIGARTAQMFKARLRDALPAPQSEAA